MQGEGLRNSLEFRYLPERGLRRRRGSGATTAAPRSTPATSTAAPGSAPVATAPSTAAGAACLSPGPDRLQRGLRRHENGRGPLWWVQHALWAE